MKPDGWQDALNREFQTLQLLKSLDIAPRPVFYDPEIAPIVVYEFMEGKMWDRYKPAPDELTQLAELWTKMHTTPIEGLLFSRDRHAPVQALEIKFGDSFTRYLAWTAVNFPTGQHSARYCLDLLPQFQTMVRKLD